jgi:Tol biopolymer transport system component
MSPEQAKGFSADHRSDIFSFGIVLFEMLSGRQPFQGDTAPDVLASVLVRDPDATRLPSDLNPRLIDLVKRCLEKNPRKRWQAIGDLRAELESLMAAPRTVAMPGYAHRPQGPLWRRALPAVLGAVVAAALAGTAAWRLKPEPEKPVYRFSMALPGGYTTAGRQMIDVSPGGDRIAYVANNQLYVRHVSEQDAIPVRGTSSLPVTTPAFSQDGQSIAFYAVGEQVIKRVDAAGGTPLTIGRVELPLGISWAGDKIFAGEGQKGILRLSANGEGAETVVKVGQQESAYGPHLLPDGDHLLFTLASSNAPDRWERAKIVIQSLRSGDRKILISGGSDARHLRTGHIVYVMAGTIYAVRFDPRRLETVGTPVVILEGVMRAPVGMSAASQFAVSANGVLAYVAGPTTGAADRYDLSMVNRRGETAPLKLPPGPYESPRVSRDGKWIAFGSEDSSGSFVLVHNLDGKTAPRRLTFNGKNRLPIWTADGKRVVFQSDHEGDPALFWQAVDGSGKAERLTKPAPGEQHIPDDCSADGETCLFTVRARSTYSLWSLSLRDRRTAPVAGVEFSAPSGARFSRDGRWIAYGMRDSTRTIVVEPFPATGAKFQLIQKPGDTPHHPLWSPDGRELLYNPRPGGFEAVPVITAPTFGFGVPVEVPRNFRTGPGAERAHYDMMPDGRILGLVNPFEQGFQGSPQEIRVVLNWFEELKGKLPK